MKAKRSRLSILFALVFITGLTALAINTSAAVHAQAVSSTSTPTRTPPPTPTASTTPVPSLQLPDWMRDPAAQVVVLFAYEDSFDGGGYGGPTFLNVETGERFILELSYVDKVGWVDASDGLYIRLSRYRSSGADNSDGFTEYVHLDSGKLTRLVSGESGIPVSRAHPLFPVGNGGDLAYYLDAQVEWVAAGSESNTYQLAPNTELIVTNTTTGETVYDIDLPVKEIRSLTAEWFGGGRFLGIWGNRDERIGASDYIYIYDMDRGEPLFFDEIGQARWSDHHNFMLYREMYFEDHPICLMNVENYVRDYDCEFLQEWEAEHQSEVQDYWWSNDGKKIIFTYRSASGQSGGLCVADAESLLIDCPLQKSVTAGRFSGFYQPQSDQSFGYYRYINLPPEDEFWDMDVLREAGVCLINQRDYTADCFTDRLLPAESYTNQLSRSPDGDMLAVMYIAQDWRDGVCFAHLQRGEVTCPDPAAIYGLIDSYGWSPDGRYFLVMYNGTGPFSDDKSNTQFGIFDTLTGKYRDEGYASYENSLTGLWRPSLNPER